MSTVEQGFSKEQIHRRQTPFLECWLAAQPRPHIPWRRRLWWRLRYAWTYGVANPLHWLACRLGSDCPEDW